MARERQGILGDRAKDRVTAAFIPLGAGPAGKGKGRTSNEVMLEGSQPPPDLGPPPLPASLPEFRGIQVVKPTDILALRSFDCSQELRLLPSALEKEGERVCARVCLSVCLCVCVGLCVCRMSENFSSTFRQSFKPNVCIILARNEITRVASPPTLRGQRDRTTERWTLELS